MSAIEELANMKRFARHLADFFMKRGVGISCLALAMCLTYVLHVGPASFATSEVLGNALGLPHDRSVRLVVALPCFFAGWVFMVAVVFGMIWRHRIAFWASGAVFVVGVADIVYLQFTVVEYVTWLRLLDAAAAVACLGLAIYCWRLSKRHCGLRTQRPLNP